MGKIEFIDVYKKALVEANAFLYYYYYARTEKTAGKEIKVLIANKADYW